MNKGLSSLLQHTTTRCNTASTTTTTRSNTATGSNKQQHTATHYDTLKHIATHCQNTGRNIQVSCFLVWLTNSVFRALRKSVAVCCRALRGSLHTDQFLTRLKSLRVKNKNTREAIRNRTVPKTLSMSDMILKFFFIALNTKTDWTLQNLPTEIVNKNMERFNLHLQPPRLWPDRIVEPKEKGAANLAQSSAHIHVSKTRGNIYLQ